MNKLSKNLKLSWVLALGLFTIGEAQESGSISGTVIDQASGAFLNGAQVRVMETGEEVLSQRGGSFFLQNVTEGTATLRVSYLGLAPVEVPVTVEGGKTAVADITLSGMLVDLETYTVKGTLVGQARALNFQRNHATLSNVVAADAIGRFPDQNAAEALNRLPGVSVERDQGEGRFVVIRGIDPNLNAVAIDGVKLASPGTGERATLLDTIPSDTLQRLEVYKSTLPSQPGDSVGGYINIRTPSVFDENRPVRRIELQSNYTDLAGKWNGKAAGAFGTLFADGTMGLMLNASYEKRAFGSDNNESDVWEIEEGEDGSEGYASGSVEFREYDLTRTRTGLSSSLEFQPDDTRYFFLRASWNEYEDTETRNLVELAPDAFEQIGADSFVGLDTEVVREFKDRTEKMRIFALSAGGEHELENGKLDYRIAFSSADEDTPFDFEAVYEFDDVSDLRFKQTRGFELAIEHLDGGDFRDPSLYAFDGISLADQLVTEEDLSAELNYEHHFEGAFFESVKAGLLARAKEKDSDLEVWESDDQPAFAETMEGNVHASVRDPFRTALPALSLDYTGRFLREKEGFAMEWNEVDASIEDFEASEDVMAAYLMGSARWNGWELIAGFRAERTEFETSGYAYNDDEESITPVSGSNSYTHLLPGLHLKKMIDDTRILRFSANQTIARPGFEQTFPNAEIEGDEVSVGNPLLDPLESSNLDLSYELYLEPLGLFSVASFYKSIENFIYEQVSEGPYGELEEAEITTFRNGDSGSILGFELAYQRQFASLPAPFDGLGLYANLTWTDSEATVLAPELGDASRKLPFIKQSDLIGNLALTYEKHDFFVRLSYTFRNDYLDEVGESALEDRYIKAHGQWDLSMFYNVNERFKVFANVINLNDEPLQAYWGESKRLSQHESYGWSMTTGVKWSY
jgi:TonB-dependent receptor